MTSLFAESHNMVAILEKSEAAGGFEQIIDFLSGSYIHHALTVNPHVYISCIKQFWNIAVVKRSGDVTRVRKGFSGVETPLFKNMLVVRVVDAEEEIHVLDNCSALILRVKGLENANAAQQLEIIKLKARVKKLERLNKVKSSKLRRLKKEDTEVQEAVEVVTTAKLITEVVTAVATQVAAASTHVPVAKPKTLKIAAAPAVSTRRRKGVVIRDPEEELHTDTLAETPTVKDKGKGILIEDPKPMKKKDQVVMDAERSLEIIQDKDDDVFVEAILLAQKVPVVDYQRRSGDFMEDSKRHISTNKPTNFLDEYLLLTLKTMFGELDEQDPIWRNQKSVHGLALVKRWKLLTSCGVYVIILLTIQLFLLVKRRYPLSRFTLGQLVNVARLQVEEESEMSLELLRFTRQ
nr:hypothetical protein [Tanacetum cinerariifolium]